MERTFGSATSSEMVSIKSSSVSSSLGVWVDAWQSQCRPRIRNVGDRLTELKLALRDLPGSIEEKGIKDVPDEIVTIVGAASG